MPKIYSEALATVLAIPRKFSGNLVTFSPNFSDTLQEIMATLAGTP